jgi:hypothetical protein
MKLNLEGQSGVLITPVKISLQNSKRMGSKLPLD